MTTQWSLLVWQSPTHVSSSSDASAGDHFAAHLAPSWDPFVHPFIVQPLPAEVWPAEHYGGPPTSFPESEGASSAGSRGVAGGSVHDFDFQPARSAPSFRKSENSEEGASSSTSRSAGSSAQQHHQRPVPAIKLGSLPDLGKVRTFLKPTEPVLVLPKFLYGVETEQVLLQFLHG